MKTVLEIVEYVSGQMQDQRHRAQYTRWSIKTLVGYLSDGLAEISALKPELFHAHRTMTLVPGSVQTVPDDCTAIVRVEGNPDGTTVYMADVELMRAQGTQPNCGKLKYDAAGNAKFNVRSFSVDPTSPKTFYVSPAVPQGVMTKVDVSVVLAAPTFSTGKINEEVNFDPMIYVLVQDYMMARAYERDSESAESKSNSVAHFTKFYQFFNIAYKVQSAYRSGNYDGRTAASNPATAQ